MFSLLSIILSEQLQNKREQPAVLFLSDKIFYKIISKFAGKRRRKCQQAYARMM